jgi:D-alanyl-D-alanine carboxypeptidase (penicillin-binding protein 5/6)
MYVRTLPLLLLLLLLVVPVGSASADFSSSTKLIATYYKRAPQQHSAVTVIPKPVIIDSPLITFAKRKPSQRYLSAGYLHNKLTAKSIYVMDATSGETLYAKSPDIKRQPASTIKILTGILALQHLPGNARVPVSRRAANMPRSKVYLRPNKQYMASDLINAVLLASANDASVALAEKIAGSEQAFAKMMTRKARKLGAKNTVCRTASGLTAKGQYTTARDLAVMFNQVMQNEEFASRMHRSKAKTREGKTLRNHNKALWQISGTEGGKTGFTRAARQTYVGRFKRGEDEILVAIMGSRTMWQDIRRLVEYGFSRKQQLRLARKSTPALKSKEQKTS